MCLSKLNQSDVDEHIAVQFKVSGGANGLRIILQERLWLEPLPVLPALGSTSQACE